MANGTVERNPEGYRMSASQPLLATARYFYSITLNSIVKAANIALDGNDRTAINETLSPLYLALDYFKSTSMARQQLEDHLGIQLNLEELRNDANEIRFQHLKLDRVRAMLPVYQQRVESLK